jgi:hypothetical protein
MNQTIFNPAEYCFKWTTDWYTWDRKRAHSEALKARNAEAKKLRASGYHVRTWTLKDQLITRGGIGSGKPEISMVVNCYAVNYS